MGNAFLLIVVGLFVMYVILSNKYYCLEGCVKCIADKTNAGYILTGPDKTGGVSGSAGGSIGLGGIFGGPGSVSK